MTNSIAWIVLACLAAAPVLLWFFCDDGPREEPSYRAISTYREWQSQAHSWSDFFECDDMIEEEMAKANRRRLTPYQRLRQWWRS